MPFLLIRARMAAPLPRWPGNRQHRCFTCITSFATYSNPIMQPLFTALCCENGNIKKRAVLQLVGETRLDQPLWAASHSMLQSAGISQAPLAYFEALPQITEDVLNNCNNCQTPQNAAHLQPWGPGPGPPLPTPQGGRRLVQDSGWPGSKSGFYR